MTLTPAILPATRQPITAPSIWIANRSPTTFNEGATIKLTIQCVNAIPGVSKVIWKLAGNRAADAGWSKAWDKAWQEAMEGRAMTYTKLPPSANQATIAGLIEVHEGYDGKPIELTITCIEDKRTQVPGGNPGQMQVTIQMALPSGSTGTLVGNGTPMFIMDTSKTPAGTPTYRLQGLASDMVSGVGSPPEGASFYLRVMTENITPGSQFLLFAANKGYKHLAPDFKVALKAAAQAAGCTCVTSFAEVGPYHGGIVTFTENYDDSNPILIPLTIFEDNTTTGAQQLDFITQWKTDGDPDLPILIYNGTVSLWIQDTSLSPTPSYWRIEAKRNGGNISYRLTSPTGVSDASVALASTGTEPAGFWPALQNAADVQEGISFANGRFTSTPQWSGALEWVVPVGSQTGKHALRLSAPSPSESLIIVEDAAVFLTPPSTPVNPTFVTGINLAGGEFGSVTPGTYARDYFYPSRPENAPESRHLVMDYYLSKGAKIMRLPVKWERIQESMFGPLRGTVSTGGWSGVVDMLRIDEIISYWTGMGNPVLLDVHNYMSGFGSKVGFDLATPTSALCDLWVKLADRYKDNPLVWFGIMNEPNGGAVSPAKCADIMHSVVQAIRGRTDALNRILVTGTYYSGAWSWISQGNASAFQNFYDPADNFVIEVHQYFDTDSSGTQGICVLNANTRLQAVTNWAKVLGFKLFLGEFAGGDPAVSGYEQCGNVVPAACSYMAAHTDVWAGWTAWGGGQQWPASYFFRLDPQNYLAPTDTGSFDLIEPYLGPP